MTMVLILTGYLTRNCLVHYIFTILINKIVFININKYFLSQISPLINHYKNVNPVPHSGHSFDHPYKLQKKKGSLQRS